VTGKRSAAVSEVSDGDRAHRAPHARLDADLPVTERAEAVAAIEAEESARGVRKAVAGFDFTFSIPKSASVLWAVSDAGRNR
jgi:hypothetical protein